MPLRTNIHWGSGLGGRLQRLLPRHGVQVGVGEEEERERRHKAAGVHIGSRHSGVIV